MPSANTKPLLVVTYPARWASAIVNLDYSGLERPDVKELNTCLLVDGVSFVDCLTCSAEYVGKFKGQTCQVSDFTFKTTRQ